MTPYSSEQLNFFKFADVAFKEFPPALRRVFAYMWDTLVAPTPGCQPWDDSQRVRDMFLAKEGGKTKHVPIDKSYEKWDCTALFEATLYAQSFARPIPGRKGVTLADLYVNPRRLLSGEFHPSVTSPTSNDAETFALALDQLRLLRNSLCHKSSSEIDKETFDQYIQLSKDAFAALKQSFTNIDEIGKLTEKDFPTERVQQLENELRREKLRMDDVRSDMKDVKAEVTYMRTKIESVESDFKEGVADLRTTLGNVETDVNEVKTMVANVATNALTTAIKSAMENVGSEVKDVKAGAEDAKTSVEAVGLNLLDLKMELRAGVEIIEQAAGTARSKGHVVPPSCLPDKIPHFYGRQKECDIILGHLMGDGNTRVVDIWGSPGFGKTSVAINIAHHLRENAIPVYFISLRGMKSKDEIVSRLLSIFADAKHVPRISLSDWLIQCLKQLQNPFVLILDNADDVLESGETTVKDEVLKFSTDILAHCCNVKLLFTTRESLDYWKHEVPIHLERVGVLEEIPSAKLVKSLLLDVSENNCTRILKECGQVPLAMRLMCSIMREENVSLGEVLEELKTSTLVEVLDNERFPHDSRLKSLINTSFQRLLDSEKEAFVSLAVFSGNFEIEEARVVSGERAARKILRALEAKSLIESHHNFRSFTIHSLLRSFIDEKKSCDAVTKITFHQAQLRFFEYYIEKFETANEIFFTGRSNDAVETFVSRRETIIESLVNGTREGELFDRTTQVLSKADLFLFSVLHDEESTFNSLYDAAVEEAQERKDSDIKRKLLAAKSFGYLGWFNMHEQDVNCSLQHSFINIDAADCPPKLLCYFGIYKLLCGKLEEGISSLERFVNCPIYDHDENVFMILSHHVLAVCYRKQNDHVKASHFEATCSVKSECASLSPAFCSLFLRDTQSSSKLNLRYLPESVVERDAFFFSLTAELLPSLYNALGKQMENELSVITTPLLRIQKVLLALFKKGEVRVRVLETCCIGLHRLNYHKEAAEGFEMIADQLEKALGNHEDSARNYHNLGLAQREVKEYSAAQCSFKKALEMRIKLLQETEHSSEIVRETIDSMFCLVDVHVNGSASIGDIDIFMDACDKIEDIIITSKENEVGKVIVNLSSVYNKLSHYLCEKEDHNRALTLLQRAIKMTEEHLGDNVETAKSLINEGAVYLKMERYVAAQKSFRRALDLRRKLGVEDHEDTAFICHGVGIIHFRRSKFHDALKVHRQGLRIRERHLGDGHLLTASSLDELALCYYKTGKYKKAEKNFSKAAELKKQLLGNHLDTAKSFHNLSEIYFIMETYSEALDACEKALNIRLEISPEHVLTATELHLLGRIQFKMGDFKAAVRSFRRASDMRSKLLSERHQDTALSYHCLGESQYFLGDFCGAVESLLTASTIRNGILGHHSATADTEELLGRTYLALGEHDLSSQHIRKALGIRELCENTVSSDPSDPLLGRY